MSNSKAVKPDTMEKSTSWACHWQQISKAYNSSSCNVKFICYFM